MSLTPTFDHRLISSLKEFIDYKLITKSNAYEAQTLNLYRDTNDPRLSNNYTIYSSQKSQWALPNTSISTVSGITSDQGNYNRGDGGMRIDFKNGRVIFDDATNTGLTNASINVSVKHFKTYIATQPDSELFVNSQLGSHPGRKTSSSGIKPYQYYGPALFLKWVGGYNEGLELGGKDKTIYNLRCLLLCRSQFEREVAQGALRDLQHSCFQVLDNTPLNEFGDLKDPNWTYESGVATASASGEPKGHIDKVMYSEFNSEDFMNKNANIYAATCNFTVFVGRLTRQ